MYINGDIDSGLVTGEEPGKDLRASPLRLQLRDGSIDDDDDESMGECKQGCPMFF
jgi:hypothetical protein